MKSTTGFLLFIALALPTHSTLLADPNFRLQDGDAVTVDPDTNRATVTQDGVTTPLWDGTHRMQDGSVLIINQGISVPGEPVPETRQQPLPEAEKWEGAPIVGYSPCETLARRVCGKENQCGKTQGCNLAQQLLGMEQKERATSENRNRMTYTSGQCQTMASDAETFPLCAQQNAD
ncbi:MAG: hypothetical protein ABFS45_25485 [Pseudomonadota bacterium]